MDPDPNIKDLDPTLVFRVQRKVDLNLKYGSGRVGSGPLGSRTHDHPYPLPFKASLHSFNLLLASSFVSATKTISSASSMHHGTVSQMDFDIFAIMTVKMKGLSANPLCSPTLIEKDSVIPIGVCMVVKVCHTCPVLPQFTLVKYLYS